MMMKSDGLNGGIDMRNTWRPTDHMEGLRAVSYTHLDVYKRQVRTCKS